MKVKLVGLFKGQSKKTGEFFSVGYFTHEQKNVQGVVTFDSFLGNTIDVDRLEIGKDYNAFFGRSGKNIELLQKA